MRMLELWQLLQSPDVTVDDMDAVSGHLLIWTVAGNAIEAVV
jgi:hypothetical protein